MRTIAEVDAAAAAFATILIDKTETIIGRQFDPALRSTVLNAIAVGYHQGVLDERDELLKGGGK
jgi:hypothetical protein